VSHVIPSPGPADSLGFAVFLVSLGYVALEIVFTNERRLLSIETELETARQIQSSIPPAIVPDLRFPDPMCESVQSQWTFGIPIYFKVETHTGYERLLYDCMVGDATLFRRADMLEAGWAVVDPILDVWKALGPRNFPNYAAGTLGTPRNLQLDRVRRPPLAAKPYSESRSVSAYPRRIERQMRALYARQKSEQASQRTVTWRMA
jgi:hypothetical protein